MLSEPNILYVSSLTTHPIEKSILALLLLERRKFSQKHAILNISPL